MSGFNTVVIAGNLGQDAESVVVGAKNTPKVTFSVAVNHGTGEQEHTEWIRCVFWGARAAKLAPHLTQGTRLVVEGRWQSRTWEETSAQGTPVTRSRTELIVSEVAFRGYNRVVMVGNLAADAELAYSGAGKPYLKFRMGVNTGFGEHTRTAWLTVTLFGTRAEGLAPHLVKGTALLVSGEYRTSEWETPEGETRRSAEIVVAPYHGDVVFMGRRRDAAEETVLDY